MFSKIDSITHHHHWYLLTGYYGSPTDQPAAGDKDEEMMRVIKQSAKLKDIRWKTVGKVEHSLNPPERYRPSPGSYEWDRPRYRYSADQLDNDAEL